MLCYCNKCGRLVSLLKKELNEPCDYCQNITQQVPDEYLGGKSKGFIKPELEQQFIDEYIKNSPEFDQYLFDHRDEDLFKRRMENKAKLDYGKAILEGRDKGNKFGVECPYCHATNVKKIILLRQYILQYLEFLVWAEIQRISIEIIVILIFKLLESLPF